MADVAQILVPEALSSLLTEFRLQQKDKIGLDQFIAAQDVILALAAQGRLPATLDHYKTLLAPIVCSSPAEQKAFYAWFDGWLERRQRLSVIGETLSSPASDQPGSILAEIRRRSRLWPFVVLVVLFLLGIFAGSYFGAGRKPKLPEPLTTSTPIKTNKNGEVKPPVTTKTRIEILGRVVAAPTDVVTPDVKAVKSLWHTLPTIRRLAIVALAAPPPMAATTGSGRFSGNKQAQGRG